MTSSKSVVEFLVSKGCVIGDKIRNIKNIPNWISQETAWQRGFVRGLLDTDGCLFIHQHHVSGKLYKNIGLCLTNHSTPIIQAFARILQNHGIPAKISRSGKHVYVYTRQGVEDYLIIFNSNNPRITSVYQKWRDG